ncbi:MAG TPA: hypothetical protein PLW86_13190 [Rhodocyclaceae bacterium]|nr:hypothetical protein [Rhodocyclaceae bacterium]
MGGWLSAIWEPNWRSYQYFNIYRFVVALLLLSSAFFPSGWLPSLNLFNRQLFEWGSAFYACFVGVGLFLSWYWRRRFNFQLTVQVAGEALGLSVIMYALGGIPSGIGLVLLISMASAGLVGRGRLVLFYAALAAVCVLVAQAVLVLGGEQELGSLFQTGLLAFGFFATAILARLLGQRIMANEELARQRGIALANEMHIGERILERMQDGVLIVGREGIVQRHTPGALLLLGFERLEGLSLGACALGLQEAYASWPGRGRI